MLKQPRRWLGRLALVGLIGLVTTSLLPAQTQFTGLRGNVTDPSDLAVPGADVTATNEETGLVRATISNDLGQYELRGLVGGSYTLQVELTGFKQYINRGVFVYSREVRRVDVGLEVGELAESITVEEVGATIGTDKTDVNYKLPQREIDAFNVGASMIYKMGENPGSEARAQVHGGYANNTQAENDGIATNAYGAFRVQTETVSEIQQVSFNAPAEFRTSTALIGIGRSGTNTFHGEAYVHVDHQRLYALPVGQKSRPPAGPNYQWNYEFSGPFTLPGIYDGKNKTFWHINYRKFGGSRPVFFRNFAMPTPKMRRGDVSEFSQFLNLPINNPYTGERFPDNAAGVCCQIPQEMIDPLALRALELAPIPNHGPEGSLADNFRFIGANLRDYNEVVWRIDHQITDTNNFTFNWYYVSDLADEGANSPFLNDAAIFDQQSRAFSMQDTHTFSASTVNEFMLSSNRQNNVWAAGDIDGKHYLNNLLGITDLGGRENNLPAGPGSPKLEFVSVGRDTGVHLGSFAPFPSDLLSGAQGWMSGQFDFDDSRVIQVRDNVSHSVGAHLLKAGLEVRRQYPHNYQTIGDTFGNWKFDGRFTGYDFADFLLGLPHQTVFDGIPDITEARIWEIGMFVQDEWKARDDLTISLGARFQHYGPPGEQKDRFYNFDLDRLLPVVPSEQGRQAVNDAFPLGVLTASEAGYPKSLVNFKFLLIDPRIGVAFRPDDNWVIRVGYGMYHVPYASPAAYAAKHIGDQFARAGLLAARVEGPFKVKETFGPNVIVDGVPQLTLAHGFPAPGTGSAPLLQMTTTPVDLRAEKWPLDQQWNLTVERELGMGFATRVSYVGTRGLWWPYVRNLQKPPASNIPFTPARRPYGPDQFETIYQLDLGASSSHHGLEVEMTRQFSRGLYLRGWFSWLETVNDVVGGLFQSTTGREVEDPYDRKRDKGFQAGYTPLQSRIVAVWDIPVGRGQHWGADMPGIMQHLFGNWRIAPLWRWRGGSRFHAGFSGDHPANTGVSGGRPDQLCEPNQDGVYIWNRSCFAVPEPGRYGTSERGALIGIGSWSSRINLFKKWYLTNVAEMGPYFEVDAYVGNPLNYAGRGCCRSTNVSSPAFGESFISAGSRRSIHIRLRLGF